MATGEKVLERVDLHYIGNGSNKEYHLQLIEYNDPVGFGVTKLYRVDFQYGRRGSTLNTGTKIADVDFAAAQKTYNRTKRAWSLNCWMRSLKLGAPTRAGTF
jgi:hypothetical protein